MRFSAWQQGWRRLDLGLSSASAGRGLWVCALALAGLTGIGLCLPHPAPGQFGIGYGLDLQVFVSLAAVQAVIYAIAVGLLLRGGARLSLTQILAVAALLRLIVLVAPPFLSNDMYRYIWDGWVQARGINPYRYIPADPHLAFLRDTVVYPHINRADYAPTIYPPAAEMLFFLGTRLAAALGLPPVLAMKAFMVSLEAIGIAALTVVLARNRQPATRILIYAWNPLPVWEFAGSGHVDAIVVCFVALALLAGSYGQHRLTALPLAIAALAKFLPMLLLAAFWRRPDWKFPALLLAVMVLGYLPYLGAGWHVFGFLGGYAAQEHLTSGQGVFLLNLCGLAGVWVDIYFFALAGVLLGLAGAMLRRPAATLSGTARRISLLIGVVLLGLSPHYPWYYAWALLTPCIALSPASLYLASASFLLYLNPTHTKSFWPAMVFAPFMVLGAGEVWRAAAPACLRGAKS